MRFIWYVCVCVCDFWSATIWWISSALTDATTFNCISANEIRQKLPDYEIVFFLVESKRSEMNYAHIDARNGLRNRRIRYQFDPFISLDIRIFAAPAILRAYLAIDLIFFFFSLKLECNNVI